MSIYMITYFISDTLGCGEHHDHDDSCGCEGNHNHEPKNENSEVKLIRKIKSLGSWAQFMPEGFFVKTSSSAQEIFDELNSETNSGDILFVTKIDGKTSACANSDVLDWLEK